MSALNNLDLNLLKALYALLEERNVTRAAERLALTQPAVSAMLSRLRHYFNDPILVRTAQGMQPTNRALEFAEPLKRIFGELETLVKPTALVPSEWQYTLRIASTDNGLRAIGIPFVQKLQQLAPNVKVAFLTVQSEQLETMLEKGELDMAMIANYVTPERLRYRQLYAERYVCVMRKDHPALQQNWDLDTFCHYNFILGSFFGGGFFGAIDKELAKHNRQRNVILSVQNFALIPSLLHQSDCLAVVPAHLIQPDDDLVMQELPEPLDNHAYDKWLVWSERSQNDVAQQWVRDLLVESVKERA